MGRDGCRSWNGRGSAATVFLGPLRVPSARANLHAARNALAEAPGARTLGGERQNDELPGVTFTAMRRAERATVGTSDERFGAGVTRG